MSNRNLVKLNKNGLKKVISYLEEEAPNLRGRLVIKDDKLMLGDLQLTVMTCIDEDAQLAGPTAVPNVPQLAAQPAKQNTKPQQPVKPTSTIKPTDPETMKMVEKLRQFFPTKQDLDAMLQKLEQGKMDNKEVNDAYKTLGQNLKIDAPNGV